jgi:ATP-dependent Clp protease adaptor protein ClpS
MSNVDLDVKIDEKIKKKIKEPGLFKVIFLNDDVTPMEFVVSLLIEIFKHSEETAHAITMKIHDEGSGVVGIFSFEIAEQKSIEATNLSRDNGFPLRVKIEEEA